MSVSERRKTVSLVYLTSGITLAMTVVCCVFFFLIIPYSAEWGENMLLMGPGLILSGMFLVTGCFGCIRNAKQTATEASLWSTACAMAAVMIVVLMCIVAPNLNYNVIIDRDGQVCKQGADFYNPFIGQRALVFPDEVTCTVTEATRLGDVYVKAYRFADDTACYRAFGVPRNVQDSIARWTLAGLKAVGDSLHNTATDVLIAIAQEQLQSPLYRLSLVSAMHKDDF